MAADGNGRCCPGWAAPAVWQELFLVGVGQGYLDAAD